MRKEYKKLVRDRVPGLLKNKGVKYEVETLSEEEYRQALRQKLMEEAKEVAEASWVNLAEEIADLLEVIDALMEAYGIKEEEVFLAQDEKRAKKGDFQDKTELLWTEENSSDG